MVNIVLYIIELALSILKAHITGAFQTRIPESLIEIVRAGYDAYERQTGKPLLTSMIRPYDQIGGQP
jgi:hypothetical protein